MFGASKQNSAANEASMVMRAKQQLQASFSTTEWNRLRSKEVET